MIPINNLKKLILLTNILKILVKQIIIIVIKNVRFPKDSTLLKVLKYYFLVYQ